MSTKPILKWAGGKRQLLDKLKDRMPSSYKKYYEPFVGGGALIFDINPISATINDYNEELINVYLVIKNKPIELINQLKKHRKNHCNEYYYKIRNLDRSIKYSRMSDVEKAARIIYLNHTCFNGLYRVNKNGYYNTPIGSYTNPKILDEENIMELHKYFVTSKIEIVCGDYKEVLKTTKKGDFVYLDPPYDPVSKTSCFTDYTENGFGRNQQEELKKECDKLSKKGVSFLQSNSNTEYIRELYKDYKIEVVPANRSINSKGSNRKDLSEVLIYNY